MTDSRILVERLGNVARLRFNDPSTRNALSMDMAIELRDRLREVEQSARVIVLAGSEKAFCSGANLGDGADGARPGEIDAGLGLEDYVNPVMMTLRESRVPLVTAVRGAAAGVGASFAPARVPIFSRLSPGSALFPMEARRGSSCVQSVVCARWN
jgi:2-(1,2-epoxy-1,2-dihydrophenyl)acetyl-CoA isomerase